MKFTASDMRPNTLQTALLGCDADAFPNIHVLLVIACTLPVTTCENERSNSQLKLLKTYLRTTMSEERLSAVAMMKIHRRMVNNLDLDKLVLAFSNKHPRRMALPCLLSD
jgi:glutamate/tyrosine decarboxylase-like PLP-dependent enzyme